MVVHITCYHWLVIIYVEEFMNMNQSLNYQGNVHGMMQYDSDTENNILYDYGCGDSTRHLLQPRTRSWLWRCWSTITRFWYTYCTRHKMATEPVIIHPSQASKKSWLHDTTVSYRWYRSLMADGLGGYDTRIKA